MSALVNYSDEAPDGRAAASRGGRGMRTVSERFWSKVKVTPRDCWERSCVNPDHLEPVSLVENVRRGNAPSAINARRTHCKRGHEFTSENTSVSPGGRRTCRACKRAHDRAAYAAKVAS